MKRSLWLRIDAILWVGIVLGLVAILPYQLTLSGEIIQRAVVESGLSLPALLTVSVMGGAIQLGVVLALGLFIGERVGMGVPRLKRWLLKTAPLFDSTQEVLALVGGGIALGLVITFLDTFVFAPFTPELARICPASVVATRPHSALWGHRGRGDDASIWGFAHCVDIELVLEA
ncbi:MAG UNVERIFIED_CONTAM: hypothetical protein LVT10_21145 [Anaerolineae bacterium]